MRLDCEMLEQLEKTELRTLLRDRALNARLERLMTFPTLGPVTALTWALEIGEVSRFPSVKRSGQLLGAVQRGEKLGRGGQQTLLSKQRNKHLQCVLIEAERLAPIWNPQLARLHEKENHKRATRAVARKLVAYLLAVDRGERPFTAATAPAAAA